MATTRTQVRVTIDLHNIFHETDDAVVAAFANIQFAQKLLECWRSTYLDVRQQIQNSNNLDNLWEFDQKRLFAQTGYMSQVFTDRGEIVSAFQQLTKFVGPKLSETTGNKTAIDAIKKRIYDNLVFPLQNIAFDFFSKDNECTWKAVMEILQESVVGIEDMIKNVIDDSFNELQSSMGVFDMVRTFEAIEGRKSIHKHLKECYKDILQQYVKELNCLSEMFKKKKNNPPTYRSFPPVCGSISWARDLYLRAKRPMMIFKAHNGILLSYFGEEVKALYLAFAKEIDAYTVGLLKEWEKYVCVVSVDKLRYPVLCLRTTQSDEEVVGEDADEETQTIAPAALSHHFGDSALPSTPTSTDNFAFNPQWRFSVNFAPELLMIIRETKYLSRMGYAVPEAALNIAFQVVYIFSILFWYWYLKGALSFILILRVRS